MPSDVDLVSAAIQHQGTANGLAEQMMRVVSVGLGDAADSFRPHLLLRYRDRPDGPDRHVLHVLAAPFNEDHEKRSMMVSLGRRTYEERRTPIGICLGSEAWYVQRRPGAPHLEPRHDPARREIILVAAATLGNAKVASTHMETTRSAGGKIVPSTFRLPLCTGGVFPLLMHFWSGFADACPSFTQRN